MNHRLHFRWLLALCTLLLITEPGFAQMRPMPFAGGIPGRAQFQAVVMQRHQARALLYREALEELRKNPQAADLPNCAAGISGPCLAVAKPLPTLAASPPPTAVAEPTKPSPIPQPSTKKTDQPLPPPAPKATPPESAPATATPAASGRRIALLIGNNNYASPIPALDTPIADVSRVAQILEKRFGFTTRILKNATQNDIVTTFNALAADIKPEDHVLLFYAGHGYLMDDIHMGFWIPVGASVKTAKGWISNSDISKLLAAIPSKQLILISDSCFSGTLTKEQKLSDTNIRPEEILQRRSVVVFSSGDDEPVSDEGKEGHSIFAWSLIRALESTGDITPGVRVWRSVYGKVTEEFEQKPQYGAVMSAGHVSGGDFIFLPR
jgi:hypothetical protein